jgi:hypothetical protein
MPTTPIFAPPILLTTTTLLGLATLNIGALSLFSPATAARIYGLPYPISNPPTHVFAYLRAKGARDITLGLLYLGIGSKIAGPEGGTWREALGILVGAHCVAGVIDSWLVWEEGERGERRWVGHAVGTAVLGIVGLGVWSAGGSPGLGGEYFEWMPWLNRKLGIY